MKVLFIGLGSIASRHIRNLKSLLKGSVSISVLRSGKGKPVSSDLEDCIDEILTSDYELDKYYDAVFITNPTSMHYDAIKQYLRLSDTFFVEKPVFVSGDEDIRVLKNSRKKYYVAAPLRYCNVIQWLKNNVDYADVYSMRAISSSYLPEWRKGIDYRDSYSAHREMGGGVSIDLIHEWDYVIYLIGFPIRVKSIIGHKSYLEINSDDIAVYIAEYFDKTVEIHLDYFGRSPIRRIELYTKDDTIVADLVNQKISWHKSGRTLDLYEDRDSYQQKELQHFIQIINNEIESDNTIEEACRVLRIARGME